MAVRDIAGNAKAKDMMLAYASGKKHGTAFMLRGEPNTGKNFAALQFAKAFNCLNPGPDGDCCDACENCRLLDKVIGQLDEEGFQQHPHPDALYITTEKAQLSIDLLRNALSEANAFRALKLKKKIVIVDDAERMNPAAANSILKQLEEPKETLVTMLIVNNSEKMLPTIISRCQPVDIKRATDPEIKERLEKAGFSGRELDAAVLFSNGRIGEAYSHAKIKENIDMAAGLFKALSSKTDDVEKIFSSLDIIDVKTREKKKKHGKTAEAETPDAEKAKDTDNTGARVYLLEILQLMANMYRDLLLERMEVKNVFNAKYGLVAGDFKAYTERGIMNILKLIETAQRDLHSANIKVLFSALFFNIRKEGLT
jgi:DNA polymerase III subunit delta'